MIPLPAATHIDLPPIKVEGHYMEIFNTAPIDVTSDVFGRSHGYLSVSVDIGSLEENLTTDLLNHLIFLQKGFIKVKMLVFVIFCFSLFAVQYFYKCLMGKNSRIDEVLGLW